MLVAALIIGSGFHSGESVWSRFAYEVRPVRLTDFPSSRKHVGDPRIFILGPRSSSSRWLGFAVGPEEDLAGWEVVRRWGSRERRSIELWAIDSGLRRTEARRHEGGIRLTRRDSRGRVLEQNRYDERTDILEVRTQPPWQWGAEDITRTDSPWIAEGISFEEWWQAVRAR